VRAQITGASSPGAMRAYPHPETTIYLLPASPTSAYHFSKYLGPAAIRRGAKGRVLPLYTLSAPTATSVTETFSLGTNGARTPVPVQQPEVCQLVSELTGYLHAISLATKDLQDRAGPPPMPSTPTNHYETPQGKPVALPF
jgi:hypothetical protein